MERKKYTGKTKACTLILGSVIVRSHDSRREMAMGCVSKDKKKPHRIYQCPKCGTEAIEKLLHPEQALNSSSLLDPMSHQTGIVATRQCGNLCE